MKNNYLYKNTIDEIEKSLLLRVPRLQPNENADTDCFPYIYWMINKIKELEGDILADRLKAARWIGWVLRSVEGWGFWDNTKSRDLIRLDRVEGNE